MSSMQYRLEAALDSALREAIEASDAARVRAALARGADVGPDARGCFALELAARRGDVRIVDALLPAAVDVIALRRAINAAAAADSPEALGVLVDAWTSGRGEPPEPTALISAIASNKLRAVDTLLQRRAFMNARLPLSGYTALMWAVDNERGDLVARLLQAGADPAIPDARGRLPAHAAEMTGQRDVLALLGVAL